MSVAEDYLVRINATLAKGNREEIRDLAQEIHCAFAGQINGIEIYSRDEHGANALALKQLRGKLLNYLAECDRKLYGGLGLGTISEHIRLLENALANSLQGDELKAVYDQVDRIYEGRYDTYSDGLWDYANGSYAPCDKQTILRIGKLRDFRDEQMRKLQIAEAQSRVSVWCKATARVQMPRPPRLFRLPRKSLLIKSMESLSRS